MHRAVKSRNTGCSTSALFVMFFPQLIAGPIVHHREFIPQFHRPDARRVNADDVGAGLALFTMGLVKKVLIADALVLWSDPVFASAQAGAVPSLFAAWVGALSFTFQIYFDFSGYTDMALGLALMLGVRLPLNFDSPYKATSIIDFWRRWHMTLSRFLRDYVYIPLGGNRLGERRRNFNLMLTMLVGGLWHGAAWTFIVWGGLHGFYLVDQSRVAACRPCGEPAVARHRTRRLGRAPGHLPGGGAGMDPLPIGELRSRGRHAQGHGGSRRCRSAARQRHRSDRPRYWFC